MPNKEFLDLSVLDAFRENPKESAVLVDADGTISEIVEDPRSATIWGSKGLLRKAKRKYGLAGVVSGRGVWDLRSMIGIEGLFYAGNHGHEIMYMDGPELTIERPEHYTALLKDIGLFMRDGFSDGVYVENKGTILAFHFRNVPDGVREQTVSSLRTTLEQMAGIYKLELAEGNMVYELRPPSQANKGTVIERAVDDYGMTRIFYAGDDRSDLDAYGAIRMLSETGRIKTGICVGVCSEGSPPEIETESDIHVYSVADMRRVLKYLVE